MRLFTTIILLLISNITFAFQLTSPSFKNNQIIPIAYTCEADNISPPLAWGNPPMGTKSYALIMDDPDAPNGNWVHWVLYNISSSTKLLPENFQPLYSFILRGKNGWNKLQYGGPCPPSGTHRYIFTIYALDQYFDNLKPGLTTTQLMDIIKGHIIGRAQLIGTYGK